MGAANPIGYVGFVLEAPYGQRKIIDFTVDLQHEQGVWKVPSRFCWLAKGIGLPAAIGIRFVIEDSLTIEIPLVAQEDNSNRPRHLFVAPDNSTCFIKSALSVEEEWLVRNCRISLKRWGL